ncbi:MAG TPA: UDP-N-acetylmuramate dehydrogenase [Egibacteraceae bacterium]
MTGSATVTRSRPEPLAPFTTFHVGGPARRLSQVADPDALVELLAARDPADRARLLVLGEGSNVLIADRGLDCEVVVFRGGDASAVAADDGRITVPASARWDDVVRAAVDAGLAGIESLSGIPGTVGGAVVQNAGAYGTELAEVLAQVRVVDRTTLTERVLGVDECGFAYRTSRFKDPQQPLLVLEAALVLRPGGRHRPRYAELARRLAEVSGGADDYDPRVVREEVLRIRGAKNMLYVPDDPSTWTAGSFFTNPVVDAARVEAIAAAAGVAPADVPQWPVDDPARRKLSAAWLIERAGFPRGYALGGACLSPRHALALSNRDGRGSAADILRLAIRVAEGVRDAFGVRLVPEPLLLGFTPEELGPLA